jgi:hypothetical protein
LPLSVFIGAPSVAKEFSPLLSGESLAARRNIGVTTGNRVNLRIAPFLLAIFDSSMNFGRQGHSLILSPTDLFS